MSVSYPQPFGKYILLNKIALGGMAEIFRAKTVGAEGFEREVVIKRILPHFTEDEAFVKMFIDEATLAAKLHHANIVQIFDFDTVDGMYYIAMEYIEGKDLKKIIETGKKTERYLTVPQCIWIIIEVCKGLHYAHTRKHRNEALNLVHRDVSPHNIIISYNGEAKLMDFGIAKAASRTTKTRAGTVKGKCAYMSPEQARGKPLDGRSDLFALAVLFWEMLTRKRLFAGETDFETLSNVLKCEVESPSQHNPEVPAELDAIVLKALCKDPEERQPDVGTMLNELQRLLYSTVTDSGQVNLSGFMHELFENDIETLAAMQASEQTVYITQSGRTAASGSASNVSSVEISEAKTIAAATSSQLLTNHDDPTVLASTNSVMAQMGTGTSLEDYQNALAERRKGVGAFVAGFVLLALIAVVGLFVTKMQDTPETSPPPILQSDETQPPNSDLRATVGTVVIDATPSDAEIWINGERSDSSRIADIPIGETLRIRLKKGERESAEHKVTVVSGKTEVRLALPKEAPKELVTVVIQVPSDVHVRIGGMEKGTGVTEVNSAKPGDELLVEVYRPGGSPVSRIITVKPGGQSVAFAATDIPAGKTPAIVKLTVYPTSARVKVNGQVVATQSGVLEITEHSVGDQVKIEVSKSGLKTERRKLTLDKAETSLTVSLKKEKEPVVVGTGTVSINAKPWAEVFHKGKKLGTTPIWNKTVSAGKQKFVLKKQNKRKVVMITVPTNGKVKKVYDMTD